MYQAEYSHYSEMNRFENLDSIETKVLQHLIYSNTKHANNFWKLLKYDTLNALSLPNLTYAERLALVSQDSGYPTDKRVFLSPFIDDAWDTQCSSVYIFMERIKPANHLLSTITLTVEAVTHSKVAVINGDGDPILNPNLGPNYKIDPTTGEKILLPTEGGQIPEVYGANPNDSTEPAVGESEGTVIVPIKNRETVLVKSILAELNGLFLDGIGYLEMDVFDKDGVSGEVSMPLFSSRSFYGHSIKFVIKIAGISDSGGIGY